MSEIDLVKEINKKAGGMRLNLHSSMLAHGKKPAMRDRLGRTVQLRDVVKAILPPIPDNFKVDDQFKNIDFSASNADSYGNAGVKAVGDCVEVAQYRHLLRFHAFETGELPSVTDAMVEDQYFSETPDHCDDGLVYLESLNEYRQTGKIVDYKKKFCKTVPIREKIDGFAQIDQTKPEEVKALIALMFGMQCGLLLPKTASDQWDAQQPWEYVDKPGNEKGSWGGHGVYVGEYETISIGGQLFLICDSWGRLVPMSWQFFLAYSDEDYGLIDAKNTPNSPVDLDKFRGYLQDIVGLMGRRTIKF